MYKNEVIASDFYKSGNLILIEDVGYNEIFTKEKINNLDEWIIEIIYFLKKSPILLYSFL